MNIITMADIRKAISISIELCVKFEGVELEPYLCPAGVPSIGVGATFYEDGRRVTLKDAPISRKRAYELLAWMIETQYLPAVLKLCPAIDTPERLAALIDFSFNLGVGALKQSTLRRKIIADRWEDVPFELRKWVYGGGRKLNGLVLRRDAEASLI